jgi:predicted Zn-dependent peptidase
MTRLAKNIITYGRYIDFDEVITAVAGVTVEQVVELSRRYLQPDRLAMTVLGPLDSKDVPDGILLTQ